MSATKTRAASPHPAQSSSALLQRTLGQKDLLFLVIGAIIGSGIFITPATIAQRSGGALATLLLVWLLAGIVAFLGALTYGELAAMKPETGGLYIYVRDAFGRLPAFLLGWSFLFVISSGSVAAMSVAFANYLGRLVPLSPFWMKALPLIEIAVLAALNVRGARHGARVGNVASLVKAAAILAMGVALITFGTELPASSGQLWPDESRGVTLLSTIGLAMIPALFSYGGWQFSTFAAGEVKDAGRVFPRGIALGTGAIVVLYMLVNVGYVAALGIDGVAGSTAVAADAVGRVFGEAPARWIALVIAIAVFSAANAQMLSIPRIYFRMGRDGVFFRKLGEVSPRFGTPAVAIVSGALWAMVLAATGTFSQLLTYVVSVGWIFYALGAASLFVYRRREPGAARPFRVPGYPVTPLVFVAAATAVVLNVFITQPRETAFGLGILGAGTVVYLFWRRGSAQE